MLQPTIFRPTEPPPFFCWIHRQKLWKRATPGYPEWWCFLQYITTCRIYQHHVHTRTNKRSNRKLYFTSGCVMPHNSSVCFLLRRHWLYVSLTTTKSLKYIPYKKKNMFLFSLAMPSHYSGTWNRQTTKGPFLYIFLKYTQQQKKETRENQKNRKFSYTHVYATFSCFHSYMYSTKKFFFPLTFPPVKCKYTTITLCVCVHVYIFPASVWHIEPFPPD